jgi:Large eukaryotic DNA virus major capsid protein
MATGAVFKLIANDGKADRMIMATKLLNQRIKDVMCARTARGMADVTPTLVDLERTHILYVNAHFKPFAAIGYEYQKTRPQSGNPTLGSGVTFSIPQFGDFFYDMVCRTRLSQFQSNSGITPAQSAAANSAFPANGTNPDGTVNAARFYNIVDASGNVIVAGTTGGQVPFTLPVNYRNFVRYCEYPGNRLFNLVKFDVNGNPLDQYDTMIPTMLEKFCTPPNKRAGHDRLVGQEVPLTGYGGLCVATVNDADAANTPAGITKFASGQSNQTVGIYNLPTAQALPTINGISSTALASAALNAFGGPQVDVSRKLNQIVNGPQTPKPIQPPLEIWNKLRFWFNDDVRLAVASVSIPFGQRFISIDLSGQALLAFEFPSIYLQSIIDPLAPVPAGGPTALRQITYTPIFQKLGMSDISIEKMELYINNIFVNPEVHDIYIKRIGFSLIRVYRQHTQRCNQESSDEKLLSQLKWPVEYMFVGLRPVWNIKDTTVGAGGIVNGGNQNQWRDWHRMSRLVDATCDDPSLGQVADANVLAANGSRIGQVMPDRYYIPVPTVDSMTLTSHGIVIFDQFNDTFFNQYMPYQYGGPALVTPDDVGAMFVNMALFPRSYQPSGHLNISRARETYLKWTTSCVSSRTPADLLVVAIAINFLLITDGSAVLRYST